MFIFLSIAGNEGSRFPFMNVNISVDIIISWKKYSTSSLIKLLSNLTPFWWKCQPSLSQFWSNHNCPKAIEIYWRLFVKVGLEGFLYEVVKEVLQILLRLAFDISFKMNESTVTGIFSLNKAAQYFHFRWISCATYDA